MNQEAAQGGFWEQVLTLIGVSPKAALWLIGLSGTAWLGARFFFRVGRFTQEWEARIDKIINEKEAELHAMRQRILELEIDKARLEARLESENNMLRMRE